MSTDLTWIGEKARKEPGLVFTSLYHHVTDLDNLRDCYEALDDDKAVGVDGVTKEQYGENLEENLQDLSDRLKRMGYRPKTSRRSYIPKPGSEKGRPLGISCFEDKIVERTVKQVLEQIYEAIFEDSSYGYRPERSQHMCLDKLGRAIARRKVSHLCESDIRGFFDEVSHRWLVKFLEHRIGDPRLVRLIKRMQNCMTGSVRGGTGSLSLPFAKMGGHTSKCALINFSFGSPGKRHTVVFKLDYGIRGFLTHVFDSVLVPQPI